MPFCPQCNHANHHSANYCNSCGFRFIQNQQYPSPQIKYGKTDKKGLAIALVTICGFIGLCSFCGIIGKVNNSSNQNKNDASTVAYIPSPTPKYEAAPPPADKIIEGKVVGIADGDTITVLDSNKIQHKIRLQGIDAPESGQAYGQKAKQNLSDLIYGKTVTVAYETTDKYGRIIGKVLLNGKDICLEQVKRGYAWHYKEYQNDQTQADQKSYSLAEMEARAIKTGLWQDSSPIAPWDYRHNGNQKPNTANTNTTDSNDMSSETAPAPTKRVPASSRIYIRGPRGGCYYINSNRNKTYVDRSLCN